MRKKREIEHIQDNSHEKNKPATEKSLSLGAEVAGMQRYLLASKANLIRFNELVELLWTAGVDGVRSPTTGVEEAFKSAREIILVSSVFPKDR